ncbi:stage II sporulation protein M [Gilvimarinus sp. F26214L]|uniref:stage II sporulation protein M n=1 Tax=Gilvimarinus sp. DZF01 TaxID=3461371 RepID=UPI0040455D4D
MKQQDFEQFHQPFWARMEAALSADNRKRAEVDGWSDLPASYRRLCHHLALAKHRRYSPYLIDRLNALVLACHNLIYAQRARFRYQWLRFLFLDYPRVLYDNRGFIGTATLLFVLPFFALALLCYFDPEFIYAVMSWEQVREMESMYDPAARVLGREREADTDLFMFGYYIRNNIGIAFREFAGGIFFGVMTVVVLVFNGVILGAVSGHLTQLGYGSTFYPFVIGHGAFELTAIVLSGAAGLKIGMALIDPGQLPRIKALRNASREAIQIVMGAGAMLLIAAFIEAFWSSKASLPISLKVGVGALLWLLVMLYLVLPARALGRAAKGELRGSR